MTSGIVHAVRDHAVTSASEAAAEKGSMKEQLEHLIALSLLPNVTVQVVLTSGEHNGNSGSFVIATMADRSEVAYVETAIRPITTDNPEDLSELARTLVDLRARTLTGDMSCELIRKVVQEKWT
ncbi:Scr1 family TA system antitoxin-like transcriptional regulator [Actinomadura luteofluorescens]|uniref:DUF5753 domain-containing protein n=1 Tax=Actinomadura luteofluorescens TaxID=46163 RepID=A0A7Y9JG57_9ACTN|nr:Scr1 family TA system antitoxin-like transcriptional regulator [Actinomadura luteofluorescens]NYD47273.1 hypothetical protein [Actinomadura luteofluorescens]